MSSPREEPQVITYRIPRIEVYQVTDDELNRIEDAFSQVNQDLTFAVAGLSLSVAFSIALATASLSERLYSIFVSLVLISAAVALYTGVRWWRARRTAPAVIATIRSRRINPQDAQDNQGT